MSDNRFTGSFHWFRLVYGCFHICSVSNEKRATDNEHNENLLCAKHLPAYAHTKTYQQRQDCSAHEHVDSHTDCLLPRIPVREQHAGHCQRQMHQQLYVTEPEDLAVEVAPQQPVKATPLELTALRLAGMVQRPVIAPSTKVQQGDYRKADDGKGCSRHGSDRWQQVIWPKAGDVRLRRHDPQ